jgi:hypothetical protein
MSEQRLFDPGPANGNLTPLQARALAAIEATGWDGLTTDELGQVLHADKHDPRELCSFCGSAGRAVAMSLRQKQLVQQRRRQAPGRDFYMVWVAAGVPAKRPVDREYGLPEGF